VVDSRLGACRVQRLQRRTFKKKKLKRKRKVTYLFIFLKKRVCANTRMSNNKFKAANKEKKVRFFFLIQLSGLKPPQRNNKNSLLRLVKCRAKPERGGAGL
jgi:hypothetical protein